MPVVLQCTGQHQQPSATLREFGSLAKGGCWAANFSHTHHVTHVVTESLQCSVVTWNFCSLKFVTNFAYFQIPLLCVTFIAKYSFSHQERRTNKDMSADNNKKKYP